MAYAANLGRGDIIYPGLIAAWSAKGKTNEDVDRNVLKDLTGNGHDITLNNFAYSGMSGYGGYNLNLITDTNGNQKIHQTVAHNKIILKKLILGNEIAWIEYKRIINIPKLSWKVSNVKQFIDRYPNSYVKIDTLKITEDGIYNIEAKTESYPYYWLSVAKTFDMGNVSSDNPIDLGGIEIELLPEYPDALVFDGVDDYGVNESLPSLTDYTVISKIHWITSPNASVYAYGKAKEGIAARVIFSSYSSIGRGICYLYNFGLDNTDRNVKSYVNPVINYHNTKVFNGTPINKGFAVDDNFPFCLGRIWKSHGGSCNMAFYSFYLFNRTLTDEEIKSFIRQYIDPEYLLPSEIPNPDCYYDFGQGSNDDETRDDIKDYSGNGKNAKAYNIGWSGMSGYGGINVNTNYTYSNTNRCEEIIKEGFKLTFKNITEDYNLLFSNPNYMYTQVGAKIKVRISGIPNGGNFYFGSKKWINATKDGDYEGIFTIDTNGNTTIASKGCIGSTITVEFIPLYPGALVLDGIDDYISLDAFDSGFKTMFMVCTNLTEGVTLYDQRSESFNKNYSVAYYPKSIAYNNDNINGTYINGTLNTKLTCQELKNKKHLIHVVAKDISESRKPNIGRSLGQNQYSNMVLYKFLGFKEALTEEQIKAVINKYNLLDGVDNIDVN